MSMEWTGERIVDDPILAKGIVEHLHRYAFALQFTKNKVILDIASGEGYGSNLLAKKSKYVYGIDISESAILHSQKKYKARNLKFILGSTLAIPLDNNSVDVVVSFETLEHLIEQDEMLIEFKRVLKRDGLVIISTPEKENYLNIDSNNPYHLKELNSTDFCELLEKHFKNVKIFRQRFSFSSIIYEEGQVVDNLVEFKGGFNDIEENKFLGGHLFNIAICYDNGDINDTKSSIFNGVNQFNSWEENLYKELSKAYKQLNDVKASVTFKIGRFLLSPIRVLKRIVRN